MPIRFERSGTSYIASGSGWSLPSRTLGGVDVCRPQAGTCGEDQDAHTVLSDASSSELASRPFGRVPYRHAYPGIDLAFYDSEGR